MTDHGRRSQWTANTITAISRKVATAIRMMTVFIDLSVHELLIADPDASPTAGAPLRPGSVCAFLPAALCSEPCCLGRAKGLRSSPAAQWEKRHHASLLKSSIRQVNCIGAWAPSACLCVWEKHVRGGKRSCAGGPVPSLGMPRWLFASQGRCRFPGGPGQGMQNYLHDQSSWTALRHQPFRKQAQPCH